MRGLLSVLVLGIWISASAQFKNTKLADVDATAKPGIIINHKKPERLVAGTGRGEIFYSLDSGLTWKAGNAKSPFGMAGALSLNSDIKGDIYYVHLSDPGGKGNSQPEWLDRVVCQKSEDGGLTWSEGATVGNNPPKDVDKVGLWIHPKKQILYITWTQYDQLGLKDVNCLSHILFSMSTNGGSKWTKPVQLSQTPGDCLEEDNTAVGALPVVGLDGKIYVTWANKGIIFMDRSYDGGQTWVSNDIGIAKQPKGWTVSIPGIPKIMGQPLLSIDDSYSKVQGCMYLAYADQRNGLDDADIWIMRSLDHGDHWTSPGRVNQDEPGKQQFSPVMSIDQTRGMLYLAYYDRRAYDDMRTDVYLAYSRDGGASFKEVKLSESPFVPTPDFKGGIGLSAHGGLITTIWTRTDGEKCSVWTTVIKEDKLKK